MDEVADALKMTSGDIKETMIWANNRNSGYSSIFKMHPAQQMDSTTDQFQPSSNQFSLNRPINLDSPFTCPVVNPLYMTHYRPAAGDHVTFRQPAKIASEKQSFNGHARNLAPTICTTLQKPRPSRSLHHETCKTPSEAMNATVGKPNHHSHVSVYEKSFPIKPVTSPSRSGSCRRSLMSPKKSQRRYLSTVEETVREEEKEIYRQLLQMVTGKTFLTSKTPSLFPSHLTRCKSSSNNALKQPEPTHKKLLEGYSIDVDAPSDQSFNSLNAHSRASNHIKPVLRPLSSISTDVDITCESEGSLAHQSFQNNSSALHAQSEGSVLVELKDSRAQETPSAPFFQAELWIKELTSLYDSRARERRRQIEEQKALALQLQNQRLQEHSLPDSIDLRLRVPLEKEIPVTITQEQKDNEKLAEEGKEFPELSEEMEKEIRRAFCSGNQDEVLSEGFRLTITRKDIQTLNNLNWLNDEIINFYMNLLMERSKRKGLPKVHAFSTFFFSRLKTAGYQAVKRWTKKIDVFSVDILLVPIHLGVHWCLANQNKNKKPFILFLHSSYYFGLMVLVCGGTLCPGSGLQEKGHHIL
ncbi:sentrin-specific protease 1 isoform X1 [Rhinatrema bivittatum]|uniref:sentrin-specific protease 1 isoform X1 n=1 Tax=Rhinatrema bivittatum TaxID=194408 RepID=UPI001127F231|nr:sentrin-specific protease 1 isoform X1 [Rhinatrema bivittatum]XP_029450855.1 sentrin-specific protease 1 isoform X1 [Rhinatrema bivittatum]